MNKFLCFLVLLLLPTNLFAFEKTVIDSWTIEKSETIVNNGYPSCLATANTPYGIISIEYGSGEKFGIVITHPMFESMPMPPGSAIFVSIQMGETTLDSRLINYGAGSIVLLVDNTAINRNLLSKSSIISILIQGNPIFFMPMPEKLNVIEPKAIECFGGELPSGNNKTLLDIHTELDLSSTPFSILDERKKGVAFDIMDDFLVETEIFMFDNGIKLDSSDYFISYAVMDQERLIDPTEMAESYKSQNNSNCEVLESSILDSNRFGYIISYGSRCLNADKPYLVLGYILGLGETGETIDFTIMIYEDNLDNHLSKIIELRKQMNSYLSQEL